jgi:hypothetical protein
MELLVMLDAAKRASARRVTAVLPYFGYARQDRKDQPRAPITAKLVANLITVAGADRALTMDLHSAQIQGFFDIPFDHLYAAPVMIDYFSKKRIGDLVVVAPDVGGVKMARAYAKRLGADLALLNGGAIRGNRLLPEGPITRRDLHQFLPFGNVLVPLEVSGAARPRAGGDVARRRGAPEEHSGARGKPDSPSFLRGFPLTVVRSGC